MRFRFLLFVFIIIFSPVFVSAQSVQRPKLVVGLVIDQMRWDFLYRYHDRYAKDGGFKKLLTQGFSCENTIIPYTPTVTACGHASIYTGSVPNINGITGNAWYDKELNKNVYCTEDPSVNTVGNANGSYGQQSPRNLFVTTICDELRLATNFKSKVIGIAIKDRGGILAAGHSANAAYWYNSQTGDWITSTYYMNDLPQWVKNFNSKKHADKFYALGWNTLYALNTYKQSTADEKAYEAKTMGKGFPYDLKQFAGKNYGILPVTPHGNTFTFDFAKEALSAEQLGADNITDFLAISLSSPDYIGHSFGPNSIEQEDDFLRLDKELGDFLDFLDSKVGKGQYLFFLSADHGVAHIPEFMMEHNFPGGRFASSQREELDKALQGRFGASKLIVSDYNYQFHLDLPQIENSKLNEPDIRKFIIQHVSKLQGIDRVFEIDKLYDIPLNTKLKNMIANGYHPKRSGELQIILKPQWIEGYSNTGTTHGSWNPYDSQIPLLWYGWNIKPGKTNREVYMTDIAPTIAALLKIQKPSGSIGNVIEEIIK